MKPDSIHHACMVTKHMNLFPQRNIPKSNCAIITTRGNHPWITWKLRTFNPILVTRESLHKFKVINRPHFDQLIIPCTQEHFTIGIKLNRLNRSTMSLDNLTFGRGCVLPNPDCCIPACRSNQGIIRIDCHVIDWACVPLEFVGSGICFKAGG